MIDRSYCLSLEELMRRFDIAKLMSLFTKFKVIRESCAKAKDMGMVMELRLPIKLCDELHDFCSSVGAQHAASKAYAVKLILEKMPETLDASALSSEFRSLEDDMTLEMFKHRFVLVERKDYFQVPHLLSEDVSIGFPSAVEDIGDAGDCISVGLNTAAVFHLMHVVEWGMRAFAIDLGLLDVSVGRKNAKTIPIEYGQWEQILKQLPEKIDDKIEAMPRGHAKQKAQQFYHPALKEIHGFKEAWRNHVMHTRASYTPDDAIAVLSHVKRFMQSLVENGIKEV